MVNEDLDVDLGKSESDIKDKQEKIEGQIKAGAYLKILRTERELSLIALGKLLGVSASYLSNVEQGVKSMSDHFIREISHLYEVDENIIYGMLGRVPLLAREQLNEDSNLQKLLSEIKRDKKLTDDKKQKLFQQMYKLYKNFPE